MNDRFMKILETARVLVPGQTKERAGLDVLVGVATLAMATELYATNGLQLGPHLSEGMAAIADYARQTGNYILPIKEYFIAFVSPVNAIFSGALIGRGAYHFLRLVEMKETGSLRNNQR